MDLLFDPNTPGPNCTTRVRGMGQVLAVEDQENGTWLIPVIVGPAKAAVTFRWRNGRVRPTGDYSMARAASLKAM